MEVNEVMEVVNPSELGLIEEKEMKQSRLTHLRVQVTNVNCTFSLHRLCFLSNDTFVL